MKSMPVRCKLCGIRSSDDLNIAIRAGADAIGLICGVTHVSEDALSEEVARRLARLAPPYVSTVLVTHLQSSSDILGLADFIGVDTIQIHGLVDVATVADVFAKANGRRITKAIHVTSSEAIEEAAEYLDISHALHLDSRTGDRLGGTGELHDWSVSRRIVELADDHGGRPVILSGGLRPVNVASAIATVEPYAVDVNSGIEDSKGNKDADLAIRFVAAARAALC
jgi:phosphoribosylanthranilate isomerase